jgi:hypothetical protein
MKTGRAQTVRRPRLEPACAYADIGTAPAWIVACGLGGPPRPSSAAPGRPTELFYERSVRMRRICRAETRALMPHPRFLSRLTVGCHRPVTVRPFDEAILSGDFGVAENGGMVNRINSGQAARLHTPLLLCVSLLCPSRGPGQRKDRCKCGRAPKHIPYSHHGSLHWIH